MRWALWVVLGRHRTYRTYETYGQGVILNVSEESLGGAGVTARDISVAALPQYDGNGEVIDGNNVNNEKPQTHYSYYSHYSHCCL